jgi:hypothetical protein
MATGPTTVDTTTVALGLAQIRVGASAANITSDNAVLTAADSMGAMASTKLTIERNFWTLESGFPLLEDTTIAIRERAMLECAFKELTPENLAIAHGDNPASYALAHSGEIKIGSLATPTAIRMEAIYTFPTTTYTMNIIFPRAQVTSNTEIDFQTEDNANVPVTFEAKRADSGITGGSSVWNTKPLGCIRFLDAS